MLLSRRRALLLALSAVSACGFSPAYGPSGSANALVGSIAIQAPDERNGYELVKHLERRLGTAQSPQYALKYSIKTTEEGVGVTPEQEITRYDVIGAVGYTVTAIGSDAELTTGTASTFTSYSATGSTVASLSATRDAYERLMAALADQIVAQLIASSGEWAK